MSAFAWKPRILSQGQERENCEVGGNENTQQIEALLKENRSRQNNSNMFTVNTHSFYLSRSLKTKTVADLVILSNDSETGM